jgi:surfeit locus 1 family protein
MAVSGVANRDRIIAAEDWHRVSIRRHPLLLWAFALCAIAAFARLGFWQITRADEKRAMLSKAELALNDRRPQPLAYIASAARTGEYDWIEVRGRFADAPAVLLDNQQRAGKVGVRAYRAFVTDDGVPVLVELGWIALPGDRTMPDVQRDADRRALAGLLLPPPGRGLDVGPPAAQPGGSLLATAMDLPALRQALQMPTLAPRVLRPQPEAGFGFERDFDILPNTLPPERHIGYAVQWFGLACAVLVTAVLLSWLRRRRFARESLR